ncbi:RiboL-PSP-HEPN domain-containing protein [Vibrio crassostreae]|uniref:hypothetical protein n=1 Tax=Vibrio crassostreae TaxID=246167 RepID=UPI0005E66D5E|nr:hypothetical protein [Vibrio crassostreae]CAK1711401.1 RiboL-PSP-HEPN domain-containing protein [Vibrio crassostreae]CAK1759440.1 RiboL-PSP-HEPN domain-containing protein [Vibrio crassostreae]CAK1790193.1 RiboL-PSP-HEPN domain-containing protein [Vibrio crassostreae]CAK1809248.1 RiboL-PSP-HEPN domain-containing protein [Vibrio crassostreae]CAK1896971.1 RiboL-PSP-HEPN domain-containing protein [Vibrio crassostreae]
MTSSQTSETSTFSADFHEGIVRIQQAASNADSFHRKLYYSNVVSLMEKYLSDLFLYEITENDEKFNLMTSAQKFQTQKYPVAEIFNGDVKEKVITSIKNLVWHRLNDIDPLFKHTFGIRIHIHTGLTDKLALRHDLVHRNGYTLAGELVDITLEKLNECIQTIVDFVDDIENKYQIYLQQ